MISQQGGIKRAQIVALMQKFPHEQALQDVGSKMIKRIDNTMEEEIADLEQEKEAKVEKAKLRIIAQNEDEV